MATKSRLLSKLIDGTGQIKASVLDSDSIGVSTQKSLVTISGTATYSSADTLPTSASDGDQALVTSTNRLYIYSGSGWYNIAMVNHTPYWSTEAASSYDLAKDSTPTVVTILAVDSDGTHPTYSATTDSNFDAIATITKDSDNGRVFTIVPIDSEGGTAIAGTGTVTFKASDGINLVSTVSTFSIAFKVLYSNYTTLSVKADTTGTDNQVDASTNAYTITENGNVTSSAFTPYHPGGYSTYFDGSGDYLTTPTSADFAYGTGDFTIEAWVYIPSAPANYKYILGQATVSTGLGLYIQSGVYKLYGGGGAIVSSSVGYTTNVWQHIAIARSGTTLKMFLNGAEVGSVTNSLNFASGSSNGLTIGRWLEAPDSQSWYGYIADVRVVKGTAVYTSGFTPPTAPLTAIANTSLLACHLPYIADGSTNAHTITVNGNTAPRRFAPYDYGGYAKADHGGSVYFDGTGDYMTVGSASDSGLSGTFTIEFWMYLTSAYTSQTASIVSNYDGGATNWAVQQRNGGQMWLTTSVGTPLSYTLNPKTNTWYHIAFSNDSSSSTGKLFVNGIEVDDHTGDLYNSTHMAASAQPITIGRLGNNTSQDFPGYISDLRIIDGTMLYTSNFTPPTAPLTAITNTQLLTCTNTNDIWDASSGTILTKAGNTTASNTQRKFATSSAMYFDGTGDFISAPTSPTFDLAGSIAWTIEGWFYWSSLSGEQTLIEKFTGGNGPGWTLYKLNSSNALGFYSGSSATFSNNIGTVTTGQWYHVAITRDAAGTTRGFLNGTLNVSGTYSIGNNSTGNLYIGSRNGSSNYMNGYVQDVRITKGLARYTSNFTPPTSEFSG